MTGNIICKRKDFLDLIKSEKFERVLEIGPGDTGYSCDTDIIDHFDNNKHFPNKNFHVLDLNNNEDLFKYKGD